MRVEITNPKWATKDVYFFEVSKFETFEGTELRPPKWLDGAANLVLSTDNPEFPFRVIPRAWIVSVDGKIATHNKPVSTARTVIVPGSKGASYTVTLGHVKSCTCSGFQFRKHCKHIELAEKS